MSQPHPNLWHPYSQMRNLDYVPKAKATLGSKITLANNKILIDGTASWWTACHGYNHPKIIKAMKEQIDQMPHIMFGGLTHNPAEDLAKKLTNILPTTFEHVFFVDSGSVAVEVSMKMAFQYWVNNKVYTKRKFLSFKNGYHGDTLGAMSVCDPSEGMHTLFKGYLPEQINTELPINKVKKEAFKSTLLDNKHEIAAIILEPLVQCAGGFKFHSRETLKFIDDLAKENNILIIADEIATGFGRTGSMFAFDQSKIIPDIICLGKALTGGTISLAAVVANSKIYDAFLSNNDDDALMHGPTYMANPLACSAANTSIDLFRTEPRLEQVKNIEKVLEDKLKECKNMKSVIDVRVKGALGVIQVKKMHNLNWLRKKFVEDGVWIRPFLDVIYIMPSFTISNAEITKLTKSIINIIPEWECKI